MKLCILCTVPKHFLGNWNDTLEYFLIEIYSQSWTDLRNNVKFHVSQRSDCGPHSLLAIRNEIYA